MATLPEFLAALRRPAALSCVDACGRPAETSDGAPRCVPCQLRRAHLAARPDLFETQVLVAAAVEHDDVVDLGTEAVDAHMHVTQLGLLVHERHRIAWRWRGGWPTDDRTLEDILETRSLERLWGAA